MYAQAWQLAQSGQPMSALEQQIAAVVADHPEYHASLSGDTIDKDYTPDGGQSNPFLHMGLHLAIRDQVSTNRPAGIRDVYQRLTLKTGNEHDAEHQMLECL